MQVRTQTWCLDTVRNVPQVWIFLSSSVFQVQCPRWTVAFSSQFGSQISVFGRDLTGWRLPDHWRSIAFFLYVAYLYTCKTSDRHCGGDCSCGLFIYLSSQALSACHFEKSSKLSRLIQRWSSLGEWSKRGGKNRRSVDNRWIQL